MPELLAMRSACRRAFTENFSVDIYNRTFGEVLKEL